MRGSALLVVLPVVLACTDPDTDPCASFMSANRATASAFCATFTQSTVTATAGLPSWVSNCSNKPSAVSKECSCYFTSVAATSTASSQTTTSKATSTATSTGSGATATNTCGSAAINGLVGYGSGTTGGGSGSGTTVTSCAALEAAAEVGGVIKISGILDGCDIIDLISDTTVIGVGSQSGKHHYVLLQWVKHPIQAFVNSRSLMSGLTNGGFRIKKQSNVILRNLYLHDPPESYDLVELQYATNVWIDHCDFSTEGLTGDKDYYDGLLDITHVCALQTL